VWDLNSGREFVTAGVWGDEEGGDNSAVVT